MGEIKKKRKALGLTQEMLATKLNVSQATVAMWENGKTKPTIDKLKKLAQLLECSVDELI